ncbi:unnamed protein product [Closterium sp. NIES-54]
MSTSVPPLPALVRPGAGHSRRRASTAGGESLGRRGGTHHTHTPLSRLPISPLCQLAYAQAQAIADGVHPLLEEHRLADGARERGSTHTVTHSTLLFHSPSSLPLPPQLSYVQAQAIADGVHPLPAEHQLAGGQREVARAKTCIATLTAFARELRRQRQRAGALELASAELRFEFDESRGTPKRVFCKQEIPVGGSVVVSECEGRRW